MINSQLQQYPTFNIEPEHDLQTKQPNILYDPRESRDNIPLHAKQVRSGGEGNRPVYGANHGE